MDFESKFVLPKKLPPYLNEFVGFMEKTQAIDQTTARNFIVAAPESWQEYNKTGRVRKVKEKKEEAVQEMVVNQPSPSAASATVVNNLQTYIATKIPEAQIRDDLTRLLNELLKLIH